MSVLANTQQTVQTIRSPSLLWLLKAMPRVRTEGLLPVLIDLQARYGSIVQINMPTMRSFVISDTALARQILVTHAKSFKKSVTNDEMKSFLGESVLTAEGRLWKRRRLLMQGTFTPSNIRLFDQVMRSESAVLTERWLFSERNSVNIHQEMLELTLRVAARSFFSHSYEEQARIVVQNVTHLIEHAIFRLRRPFSLFKHAAFWRNSVASTSLQNLNGIVSELIMSRKNSPNESFKDLLDIMLNATLEFSREIETSANEIRFSEDEIVSEIKTLIAAGHETTANSLSWILYCLASNPASQSKLRAEIRTSAADIDAYFNNSESFLQGVIQEGLRLFPPVWTLEREATEDCDIGGITIPAKSVVMLPLFIMQRSPEYWKDPDLFVPERFSDPSQRVAMREHYFPFGLGPRMCLGTNFAMREMQWVLVNLISGLSFSYEQPEKPRLNSLITLSPLGGLPLITNPLTE